MRVRICQRAVTALLVSFLISQSSFAAISKQTSAPIVKKKPWTFLVYLNAFNSLDRFSFTNLKQMEKVGSTEKINIVVQWASYQQADVRRLQVKKDTSGATNVTSPIIQNLGQIDMGDYRNLVDFVKWGKDNFPAEHYFIAVWNHGSGWHRLAPDGSVFHTTDLSYDDYSNNHITTEQLGIAMRSSKEILGQNVDVYGSDACLMSMAEVTGELKNSVDVAVGSQHLEPGEGWPYESFLTDWNLKEDATARDVGAILVKDYVKYYPGQSEITFSAMDMSKYDQFTSSVRTLRNSIVGANSELRKKILSAAQKTADFSDSDYRDLTDFVNQVQKVTSDSELNRSSLQEVKNSASQFVYANAASSDQKGANGVSIWIPVYQSTYDTYSRRYSNLVFNQDTDWLTATKTILSK